MSGIEGGRKSLGWEERNLDLQELQLGNVTACSWQTSHHLMSFVTSSYVICHIILWQRHGVFLADGRDLHAECVAVRADTHTHTHKHKPLPPSPFLSPPSHLATLSNTYIYTNAYMYIHIRIYMYIRVHTIYLVAESLKRVIVAYVAAEFLQFVAQCFHI